MSLRLFTHSNNPIAIREIRAYERGTPSLVKFVDALGIVLISLLLCLGLFLIWTADRASFPVGFIYHFVRPDMQALIQLTVGIMFAGVILRCTAAGVAVVRHYHRQSEEMTIPTSIAGHRLIVGAWWAALYQVRGWMVALGLIRITAAVVMAAEYQLNIYWSDLARLTGVINYCCGNLFSIDFTFHGFQFPLAFAFAIFFTLLEVWVSTGLGLVMGLHFKHSGIAWASAVLVRALPMFLFSGFPLISSSAGAFDFVSLRWLEYTWFAFVDGGTTAVLRSSIPLSIRGSLMKLARIWLAFFAAFHMLMGYGVIAYLSARGYLMKSGVFLERFPRDVKLENKKRRFYRETLGVILAALISSVGLLWIWVSGTRVTPLLGITMNYNFVLLSGLRQFLLVVFSLTTVRSLIAGVQSGHDSRNFQLSLQDLFRRTLSLCRKLRGWLWGLAFILMTVFALLIAEHLINLYIAKSYGCALAPYRSVCRYEHFGWQLSQWVFGFGMAILLSASIIFSSVLLGFGVGRITHIKAVGLCFAIALRIVPIAAGLMPPNVEIYQDAWNDSVREYWTHDPLMVFADYGTSALSQMAEPYWHTGHVGGHTQIGLSLMYLMFDMWMFIAYASLGVTLALISKGSQVGFSRWLER